MRKFLRIFAVLAVLSLVATACGNDEGDGGETGTTGGTTGETALPGADVTVGLVYDIGGRGDLSFNDSAAAGLDQAEQEFGV